MSSTLLLAPLIAGISLAVTSKFVGSTSAVVAAVSSGIAVLYHEQLGFTIPPEWHSSEFRGLVKKCGLLIFVLIFAWKLYEVAQSMAESKAGKKRQ